MWSRRFPVEKTIFSIIGGIISWMFGGWSVLLTVLFILNAFDMLSGMAAAWGNIASRRFIQGVFKKCMMWVWVIVANLIHIALLEQGVSIGFIIADSVVVLFIVAEIISLSENSTKLGLPVPEPIKRALDIFNK